MRAKATCGYHAKWKRVLAGKESTPPTWLLGKPCSVRDHSYRGKSLRRKANGVCVACESITNIVARRGRKSSINDAAFTLVQQKRKRAMQLLASIEEESLSCECYYNSHFSDV